MAYLEIKNLTFTYNGADGTALADVSLSVESGEFVLLCGASGCGKTTLLRLLKREISPCGTLTGSIAIDGTFRDDLDARSAARIGFVRQNPENQTVTDTVWRELSFGLENLGADGNTIRQRVAEVCGFFGIGEWYHKKVCELSGGQKQLLALASVMVMRPSLLILDEPTAQLDPIAAAEFLGALRKINEELGVTVLLAEHRLEDVFPMASRVVLLDRGRIAHAGTPREFGNAPIEGEAARRMEAALPAAVRIFRALGGEGDCPLTVREGKAFLAAHYGQTVRTLPTKVPDHTGEAPVMEVKDACFRYGRETADVLSGLNLKIYANEILCILGANGAGKTTLLGVLSGIRRPYRGEVRLFGKKLRDYGGGLYRGNLAALPQNPQDLFVAETVREELGEIPRHEGMAEEETERKVAAVADRLALTSLFDRHPYDLSGGEAQKAALAKILLADPKIVLLDEPTKGLDAFDRQTLANILTELKEQGKTVVVVTHDVDFAAAYADRSAMFFDGQIVSVCDSVRFFSENRYYTTATARMTKPMYENAVTPEAAVELCRRNGRIREGDGDGE